MKKKLLCKCFITLGLLLFFTLLIPFTSYNVATAQAASIDKEKNDGYRLYFYSITLVKGKSFTLKADNLNENAKVSFKSDDTEIASVSDDGTITGNKVGVTNVTVTIKDGITTTSLTCAITVGPPAFSVKLTRSRIIIGLDNYDWLKVILKPSNTAEDARFSSNDPNIVSVSTGGRAKAKKLGMTYLFAHIDATNDDGTAKLAACTVIVTNTEDVSSLETYFSEHPELNTIAEADLTKALEDFFNGKSDGTAASSKLVEVSKSTMVNNLNRYLEDKFDLTKRRADLEAAITKITSSPIEVISERSTK